ncbi:penicillin acylase family protein [Alteribacter lacisalsi]|uniref:Penicillin acylase family protein n=1 Tax=Alteribacter lacisalsi TaxID=2045244 RepID=A0A2W0HGG3_9BACI|nr:penicillin acylase family protein [Alteribacter lacisalsi]PYZ98990.1 penicillin acylase family protein [Alteribacter lacisalsi]
MEREIGTQPAQAPFIKRKWVKVLVIAAGILVFLLVIGAGTAYWFVTKSHPVMEGEKTLAGLNEEVTVVRDARGVAQITSGDLEDLFYVQGYVTAQDRLFQMDMTRRLAEGRLSEVVGDAALDSDRFFRTYGMHRYTEDMLTLLDEEAAQMVEAYAAGVTAYKREAFESGTQPLEFTVLGYEPADWTPADTALVIKYMGYTLSGNHRNEIENYQLVQELGDDARFLFPEYHIDNHFPTIYEQIDVEDMPFDGEALGRLKAFAPPEYNGSNNWAISGEHTESGFPIVADDPHLGMDIPSVWYQTNLELEGDFHSIGVTVPGVPGVVLGHNEHLAWGVTSMSVDQEDLFLEEAHPEEQHTYRYDNGWEKAEVIEEIIQVDGEDPLVEQVVVTRNGPIMSHLFHDEEEDEEPVVSPDAPYHAMSLRWSGREAGEELNGVLRLSRATNVDEFMEGLDGFVNPALSWVFADTEGNIAYRGQGRLPVRQNGDGLLPVPGWDPDYQWDGFISTDELPQVVNPAEGYIMTANNKPVDDEYPYEIGRSFYPYRAERLKEMIDDQMAAGEPFTMDQSQAMQLDFTNTQARSFVPLLVEAVESVDGELSGLEQEALDMLRKWDYVETVDSPEALLWHQWYNQFGEEMFERIVDFEYSSALVIHHTIHEAAEDAEGMMFGFLEELYQRDFGSFSRETFIRAVEKSEELQGSDPKAWRWGEWHAMTVRHPLSGVWPLNHLYDVGPYEVGGSGATPGAHSYNAETGRVNHGAGWRFVADLSFEEPARDILNPGQSGQVLSSHYSDQVDTWVEGGLYPMLKNVDPGGEEANVKRFLPEE